MSYMAEGECESCGDTVEEYELSQCQLGFCGSFLCSRCTNFCNSCANSYRETPEQVMKFCGPCSDSVIPVCLSCKDRLCGRCTKFRKCIQCFKFVCSMCTLQEEHQILTKGRCNPCTGVRVKCLQLLCRDAIRRDIAGRVSDYSVTAAANGPTAFINEEIKKLDVPRIILNLLTVKPQY